MPSLNIVFDDYENEIIDEYAKANGVSKYKAVREIIRKFKEMRIKRNAPTQSA